MNIIDAWKEAKLGQIITGGNSKEYAVEVSGLENILNSLIRHGGLLSYDWEIVDPEPVKHEVVINRNFKTKDCCDYCTSIAKLIEREFEDLPKEDSELKITIEWTDQE